MRGPKTHADNTESILDRSKGCASGNWRCRSALLCVLCKLALVNSWLRSPFMFHLGASAARHWVVSNAQQAHAFRNPIHILVRAVASRLSGSRSRSSAILQRLCTRWSLKRGAPAASEPPLAHLTLEGKRPTCREPHALPHLHGATLTVKRVKRDDEEVRRQPWCLVAAPPATAERRLVEGAVGDACRMCAALACRHAQFPLLPLRCRS